VHTHPLGRYVILRAGQSLTMASSVREQVPLSRERRGKMRAKALLILCAALAVLALVDPIHAGISTDPQQPIVLPSDQSLTFMLVGNAAGAFAYYAIDYPGDGRIITISLDMAPGDPAAARGLGFNVYGPNGYFISPGYPSTVKIDRKEASWADHHPAQWLIQVYNYLNGVPVTFDLGIKGLPTAEPTPTREPVMQPSEAKSFSIASGSLLGDRGGNYCYYHFETLGYDEEVTLELYYEPDNHLVAQGFGLNVYGPNGTHCAQGGHTVTFRCPVPGTYLVQVYNYLHAINIHYVLTHQ